MRLNLQLFAYTGNSIVDYLKSEGKDSSFSARKQLASELGISNYSGTASQNTQMLNALKNKKTTPTTTQAPTTPDITSVTTQTAPANTQTDTSNQSKIKGVDQSTIDKMNSEFKVSTAYEQAMAQVNSLLTQLQSGKTSYTDQIKDLMGKIQNREDFSYDVDSDAMFQQYLSTMMSTGHTAMQDTIGQASALTGGYGSSYATSAGNQAYNQYIQEAYNNLPEYYQMALNTYQMEGEEMYNQLGMLSEADAQEYQRLLSSYEASNNNALNIYNQDYQKWSDEVANATNWANMQNTDWWNQTNYDESVRQYNENMAFQQKQYEESIRQFNAEMAYKNASLAQSKAAASAKQKAEDAKNAPNSQDPDPKMYDEALKRYNEGGPDALNAYLNSLPANINKDKLAEHVGEFGKNFNEDKPLLQKIFGSGNDYLTVGGKLNSILNPFK